MMKGILIAAIALVVLPGSLLAASMGESAGHDLDDLWAQAQSHYDLSQEDAVILLESRQVALTFDGALQTRVHRVVWIGTAVGIRGYADLRIPWNTDTSTLDVEILRTWREGQWWPDASKISDTAVVHTLPHAMDRADDYTIMRETMLLHDGVELGCIMETAYTITEKDIPAAGGIFVVPQRDPAVLTQLRVMARPGLNITHEELNGMSVARSVNPTKGQGLLWERRYSPALGLPVAAQPEAYEPAVVWSTWASWEALADHWMQGYKKALNLEMGLPESLKEKLHPALSRLQKMTVVGEYLNEMVRSVHYSDSFWRYSPRPADRTLATAYGHDLDRAVLAAALLLKAGYPLGPMFIGRGQDLVAADIPRLEDMGRLVLHISSEKDVCFDPAQGLALAFDQTYGHPVWFIGGSLSSWPEQAEILPLSGDGILEVGFSLEKDEEGTWTGNGNFQGSGNFSHFSQITTGDDLKAGYLGRLAGSVLEGAAVSTASPARLTQKSVEVNFGFAGFEPQLDGQDRKLIVVGQPAGGLLAQLPGDVHLYEENRQSPVRGLGGKHQVVTVRIQVDEGDLLHKPTSKKLENKAGIFNLEVVEEDGWLILTRSIKLTGSFIPAADWPHLRALLLEESDPANGTVLLN